MDLITLDDIEAAIGRPPSNAAEATRWGYYISSVSAFVNNYVDESFTKLVDDKVRLQADYYGVLHLPGGPIITVTLVAAFGTTTEVASYYNGLENITGLDPLRVVDVTYTHGHETVPADIKFLVTDAVVSVLGVNVGAGGTGALKSLTVGDITHVFADGTGAIVVQLSRETLETYTWGTTTYRLGGTPGFNNASQLPLL